MRTILSKTNYIVLSLLVILAFSCSTEDGAIGPEGPVGAQGVQGLQGEKGDQGDPGNGGVVSVLLENQMITLGLNEFNVPQLTQDIFDNGLVYGYVSGSPSVWVSLPFSEVVIIGGTEEDPIESLIITLEVVLIEVGKVTVRSLDPEEFTTNIRFVLVPGTAAQASAFDINDFL